MIKPKVISERAEKKMERAILEASRGGALEKARAAKLRIELARHRKYRDFQEPGKKSSGKRPRGATQDVILALKNKGEIDEAQFTAAEQIGELWEAMIRGRDVQAGEYEPRIRADGPYRAPFEMLPGDLDRRRKLVWAPWAASMEKLFILNEGRNGHLRGAVSHLTVCIDVAAYRVPFTALVPSLCCRRIDGVRYLKTVFFDGLNAWISAEKASRP